MQDAPIKPSSLTKLVRRSANALFVIAAIMLIVIMSIRAGSEERINPTVEPALRVVVPPTVMASYERGERTGHYTQPLLEISVVPGHTLINKTTICLPPFKDGVTPKEGLKGYEGVWLLTAGGTRAITGRAMLTDRLDSEAERLDKVCYQMPSIAFKASERNRRFALFLSGPLGSSERAWLRSGGVKIISVTGPGYALAEMFAALLMFLAMLLRVYLWHLTPQRQDPKETPWRISDAIIVNIAFIVAVTLSVAFVGKEPDMALQVLGFLCMPLFFMSIVPRVIAGRRNKLISDAMAVVRSQNIGPRLSLALGAALGLAAVGGLIAAGPPTGTSHIIEITRLPGVALLLLIFPFFMAWLEEYFYRGFIFGVLESRYSGAIAVAGATALQVALLIPQRIGFLWALLPLFLLSLGASLLRLKTRSATAGFAFVLGYRAIIAIAVFTGWLAAGTL